MEILGKILGTPARVKTMRLLLVNKGKVFATTEVAKRSRITLNAARKELRLLAAAGFVKKHSSGWIFNPQFKYGEEFEELLLGGESLSKEAVLDTFRKAGRLKLVLLSGVFIKNKDSRADILIVGDKLKRAKIEEGMKKIEAEIGAELSYAVFETKEFLYRLDMYDKLVRDIIDFPHEVVLQTKELSTHLLKKL